MAKITYAIPADSVISFLKETILSVPEWINEHPGGTRICPWCKAEEDSGHSEECPRGQALVLCRWWNARFEIDFNEWKRHADQMLMRG